MQHDDLDATVEPGTKGFSATSHGRRLGDLVADRVSLFDGGFAPPVMVLRRSALRNNVATMAAYCRDSDVDLAPHGKTTMAPQVFDCQLDAGAWAITVATMAQAAVCRAAGVPRVLLANELVDSASIDWVLAEIRSDPAFDFLCYVDSVAGAELLGDGIRRAAAGAGPSGARRLDVLLEMGHAAGRTGCRTKAQAREVARAAAAAGLRVVGVAGFEGGLGRELSSEVLGAVDAFLESIQSTAADLAGDGLLIDRGGGIILSAGGSIFFDRAVAVLRRPLPGGEATRCLIRSGCYVSHDSGEYERLSPFTRPGADPRYHLTPALEAWGDVLSLPEPGLAIVGLGRRDVAYDLGLPIPRAIRRAGRGGSIEASKLEVIRLNDQHAFVAIPDDTDIALGDWMSFGISHPCTTFDKWRVLPEVDDKYRVVDFIRTYF